MAAERDERALEFLEQAKSAEAKGYWERGAETMNEAIEAYPRDAEFHALLGWFTFKNDFADKDERERLGVHHLEYALDLDRGNPIPHFYLGKVYHALGNNSRAELLFKNALEADAGFAPASEALQLMAEGPRKRIKTAKPHWDGQKKKSNARFVILSGLLAVAAAGYVFMFFNNADRKRLADLERTIGTGLPIVDGYQTPDGNISFVVDKQTWDELSTTNRANELEAIRLRVANQGLHEVVVVAGNSPVAVITPEDVCTGQECLGWPGN